MNSSREPWLIAKQLAGLIPYAPKTLLKWAREGKIPSTVISGVRRKTRLFKYSLVDAALQGHLQCEQPLVPSHQEE